MTELAEYPVPESKKSTKILDSLSNFFRELC